MCDRFVVNDVGGVAASPVVVVVVAGFVVVVLSSLNPVNKSSDWETALIP